jgi:hypothetical protein
MNYSQLIIYVFMSLSSIHFIGNATTCLPATAGNEINWKKTVDSDTLETSWMTWNSYFKEEIKPSITKPIFMQKAKNHGWYKTMSILDFFNLDIENDGRTRYMHAKTAEDAYPPHSRPRGDEDIASVNYHIKTNNPVSPITVALVTDQKGNPRRIKLDGVHRLVAASIRGSKVKVFFIPLD